MNSQLHFLKKNLLIFFLFSLFFALLGRHVQAGGTDDRAWKRLETEHTVIRYRSARDLGKFCARVKYGPKNWGFRVLFSGLGPDGLRHVASEKADRLLEKVRQILDMKKKMDKVHIRIYPNEAQLHRAYEDIYQRPCDVQAWYRHANNTVYVNANDLHERMLAHELAHAVVDHHLLVKPPRATAEIIARYVGRNVKRNTPNYNLSEPSLAFTR